MKYYIYELCEPDGITTRYVGTTKDMKVRYYHHSRCKKNLYSCAWIRSLRKNNEKPIMKLIEEIDEEEIDEKETYWIAKRKEEGFKLTNHAPGGRVNKGFKKTPEQIEKMRLIRKGTKHTEETKAKMSAASLGKKKSPIAILNMIKAQTGKKFSDDSKAKMSRSHSKLTDKQVIYILQKLKEDQSAKSLAEQFGVSQATISSIKHGTRYKHIKRNRE